MDRTVPSPPELIAPVQGAPVRGDAAKLTWHPVKGATGYHVQVCAHEEFDNCLVDTRIGPISTLVIEHVTVRDKTLYWRVASIGVGGQSAFSETGEFVYSPAPAGAPYVGATAESGVETGRDQTRKAPGKGKRFDTGGGEFLLLVAAMLVSTVIVAFTFIAFPGLVGEEAADLAAQDSVASALVEQQRQAADELNAYSSDSTGFTIPIDSAIARIAAPVTEPVVLVDEGQ